MNFSYAFPPPNGCPSGKVAEKAGLDQALRVANSTWEEFEFLLNKAKTLPFNDDTDPIAYKAETSATKCCDREMRRIWSETEKKLKERHVTGELPEGSIPSSHQPTP